jgi:hypothetical protein
MAQLTADGLRHAIFSRGQTDPKSPALRCFSMAEAVQLR